MTNQTIVTKRGVEKKETVTVVSRHQTFMVAGASLTSSKVNILCRVTEDVYGLLFCWEDTTLTNRSCTHPEGSELVVRLHVCFLAERILQHPNRGIMQGA